MNLEHHQINHAPNFQFRRSLNLFSEGGISPSGECWVSPTDTFLRLWNSPAGVNLKKQGFLLQDDGKRVGASQDCILICPKNMETHKHAEN